MKLPTRSSRVALVTAFAAMSAGSLLLPATPASAAACSDVEVIFARGTGEPQGPSVLQSGFVNALKSGVGGKTVTQYSVNYPAGFDQNAQPGATDLKNHLAATSAGCPNTKFVLGGYSQGATVVDLALGVSLYGGSGGGLSADQGAKVAAAVTFGNPLGNQRLAGRAPAYANRIKEFCVAGDIVCNNGVGSWTNHFQYITNGDPARGGQFAATKVLNGGTAPAPSDPAPTPQPTKPWWWWWG
jgi:cutinase